MKDKKLFGKFNIIDVLVVLLVIAAVAFLAFRMNRQEPVAPDAPTTSRIEYVVKVSRVDPELYESAKAMFDGGDTKLLAGSALIDGNVIDMEAVPYETSVTTADGQLVRATDPYYLTVYFTIQAAVQNSITQSVVTQEVRVGMTNYVKTLGYLFTGTVTAVTILA